MGKLWDLIESHRDAQQYPPSYRQLAIKLGVSQSTFDTWKAPRNLPTRESIESIARLVGVAYQTVLDAALDDTRYRIPPSRELEERDGDDRDAAPTKRTAGSAVRDSRGSGSDPAPPAQRATGDDQRPKHWTPVTEQDIAAGAPLPQAQGHGRKRRSSGRTKPKHN